MCNESRDCKLKGSLKGYVHSTMQCCACQKITCLTLALVAAGPQYVFLIFRNQKYWFTCLLHKKLNERIWMRHPREKSFRKLP